MELFRADDPRAIEHAVHTLAVGDVVLYPTDTVYGLGADVTSMEAVRRVRATKGVPGTHPLLAVFADVAMLEEYVELTPMTRTLVEHFLPGPLSLILPARASSQSVVAQNGTVGIRIPNHPLCLSLVRALGRPYTSTSANRHGVPPCDSVPGILAALSPQAQYNIGTVVDGGIARTTQPSTIVDCSCGEPWLLREGALSRDELEKVIPLLPSRH